MQPLVSVLIPCHNAAPWLAETLESALAQTWPNLEVILVDDGSTDDSLTVARRFTQSNLRIIAQPNQGAAAARNRALEVAQGEVIQFLDADDLLAPDKIERQMALLQEHPDCLIAGAWARFRHHPQEATFTPEPLWRDMAPVDWLVCAWSGHWMMHPAAWLVPRSLIQAAGPWNETLSLNDEENTLPASSSPARGCGFAKKPAATTAPATPSASVAARPPKLGPLNIERCLCRVGTC
jgi:glycosyltransferase involved in cell wall biosynthesis